MYFFSPLETFEINFFYPIFSTIYITNFFFITCFIFFLINFLFLISNYKNLLIPTSYQILIEFLYKFSLTIVKEQTNNSGLLFFPILFLIFIFILFSNLLGLFPFSFTITAQIALTFLFAFSFNLSYIIIGFLKHGLLFLKLFVPSDAPKILIPIIVFIEVLSYLIRTFSLSIRLFANMMAGHTLLHILASFCIKLLNFHKFLGLFFFFFPFIIILCVFLLEFGIALIQAYVFIILLCIYLNDSYHPSH